MGKHTPGPWRYVRENGSPTTGPHMISGAIPGYLAEVRDCGSGDVAANARLIASAPDLLDRLQFAVYRIEDMLKGDDGQAWKEAEKFLPLARAAIAKATGAA